MKTLLLSCYFLFLNLITIAGNNEIKNIKKCFMVLGHIDNQNNRSYDSSGFLIEIDRIKYLITAKHVVCKLGLNDKLTNEIDDSFLYVFYYSRNGNVIRKKVLDLKNQFKVNWLFHKDIEVDIAILPFNYDNKVDDLKFIKKKDFINQKNLFETEEIYFPCNNKGYINYTDLRPIFRSGSISRINKDKTFLIDSVVIPGYSGSPVFSKKNKLIGVITNYDNDKDNSKLGTIFSVEFIKEIINEKKLP